MRWLLALLVGVLAAPARGDEPPAQYQLGARVRGIFITSDMLSPYLVARTSMESVAVGAELVFRRPTFDVVTSLDFAFTSPHDGNFLGRGKDPSMDTHYVEFHDLNFLSVDVSIIGHTALTRWLELRYGAGMGLGLVLGDVLLTADSPRCTAQNASNPSQCYPISPTVGEIRLNQPDTQAKLKATENPSKIDLAIDPHRHVTADKPPVLPVLNVVVGLRFILQRHLASTVELGFRDAIFVGAALHYLF
jgi:hypothetical protein